MENGHNRGYARARDKDARGLFGHSKQRIQKPMAQALRSIRTLSWGLFAAIAIAAFSHAAAASRPDGVVHAIVPANLNKAEIEKLGLALDRLGKPTSAVETIILDVRAQEVDAAAFPDLLHKIAAAAKRGWKFATICSESQAGPWCGLFLCRGNSFAVPPFQALRGSRDPLLREVQVQSLLRTLHGWDKDERPTPIDADERRVLDNRLALVTALFNPGHELHRVDDRLSLDPPASDGMLLSRRGDPAKVDLKTLEQVGLVTSKASSDDVVFALFDRIDGIEWIPLHEYPRKQQRQSTTPWTPSKNVASPHAPVVRINIREVVDKGMRAQVRRAFREASDEAASLVIMDLDTPGGRVDVMDMIVKDIEAWQDEGGKVVAYVSTEAISAGMVIALACDEIFMRRGTSIGAATPVISGPGGPASPRDATGERSDFGEKYMSYFRTRVRTLAQRTRPDNTNAQLLAEAMVDKNIALVAFDPDGAEGADPVKIYPLTEYTELVSNGRIDESRGERVKTWSSEELVTLTSSEAARYGFCEHLVKGFDDVLRLRGLPANVEVISIKTSWSEDLVRWLGGLAFFIFLAGCVLAYVEFKIPGFGIPGVLSICCFALLLFREHLAGAAEVPEMLLFFAGAALIAVEIFLLPGTLFCGIAGVICALTGLYLSFTSVAFPTNQIETDLVRDNLVAFLGGIAGTALFAWLFARYLPSMPVLGRLVSVPTGPGGEVWGEDAESIAESPSRFIGASALAITDLHPGGKIRVGSADLDAITEGISIERGSSVRIIGVEMNRCIVVPERTSPDDAEARV